MSKESTGEYLYKTACSSCGSRDNLAVYSDGGEHCFSYSCGYHKRGSGEQGEARELTKDSNSKLKNFVSGEYKALPKRKLTEETCRKWGYSIGTGFNPETKEYESCQAANYYSAEGALVAQKLKFADKVFSCVGKPETFFGRNMWSSGKFLVVTEGELDCMSYAQVTGHKYPVVSLPNGAQSAKKVIQRELKWLEESFEKIVLMFDSDEVGIQAANEAAVLFSPNKCLIAKLPEKDANEMLKAGRVEELVTAVFRAKAYRPESIVSGLDLWETVSETRTSCDAKYPYEFLNEATCGLRKGEAVTICAGSGIGKSQFCRELAYSLIQQGESIGYIALEENVRRSALGIMSVAAEKPLHISLEGVSIDQLKVIYDSTLANDRVFFCDQSFMGAADYESLLKSIRFLAKGSDVSWIILDHISIIASSISEGDERRNIDNIMSKLRSLAEELKIGIILVSHLKRPEGKGHEEGHEVSLAQLRGSASIAQLSDIVIGLERNQQSEGNSHITTVRILKNRYKGEAGIAGYLEYFPETGRLKVTDAPPKEAKASKGSSPKFKAIDELQEY